MNGQAFPQSLKMGKERFKIWSLINVMICIVNIHSYNLGVITIIEKKDGLIFIG